MRYAEQVRNRIESSPVLSTTYARIGALPAYRTLVTKRVDKRIDYIQRTRRYAVMIETSSVCNASCVFCPNKSMERKRGVMSDEVFDVVVERLRRERIAPPLIDLFDVGEPLLDKALFLRVRTLKAAFPAASIRITTNFSLADERVVGEVLSSGLDSIHISLNASDRQSYERIMGLDWDKTLANVNDLIARRNSSGSALRIVLRMVLCQDNSREERDFVRQWSRKVDSVLLQRAVDWGGNVEVASPYPSSMWLYPCNDLFERIVILSSGDMALCCQDSDGIVKLNVADQPILDIFNSAVFEEFRRQHLHGEIASARLCRNCFGVHSNGANWLFARVG
jgi:hypothetical protein